MKDYLKALLCRVWYQFFFFLGRIIILTILLDLVSSGIRDCGSSVFGMAYYYAVMPGVFCHETGHAVGCLCTRQHIKGFVPFRPEGDTLGYVRWEVEDLSLSIFVVAFIIGTAPLWFGCTIVFLLCMALAKINFMPDYRLLTLKYFSFGISYWRMVGEAAFQMLKSILRNIRLNSFYKFIFIYLLFCIISEMPPSIVDLQSCIPGFLLLISFLLLLNVIPWVGKKINMLTLKIQPFFLMIHSVMLLVLILDFFIFLCIALPFGLLFR